MHNKQKIDRIITKTILAEPHATFDQLQVAAPQVDEVDGEVRKDEPEIEPPGRPVQPSCWDKERNHSVPQPS